QKLVTTSFVGEEYTFYKQENFEARVGSLPNLDAERAQGFINHHPNQKLVQNGDSYTLITGTKEVTFQSGVPFQETIADRTAQTTFTLNGNTLTQQQKFDEGV
ncbi:hypothetical protein, partial [Enterobacter hormaechei]|uniref:hypothetical protein n=1 Tax=Enterobacter hormaechei TaxID=158836 RepID=UPI0019807A5A